MRHRSFRLLAIAGMLAAFLPLVGVQQAVAAGVVGDGTSMSCDEAAFDAALVGGGLVTFDCGPGVHSIPITSTKTISILTRAARSGWRTTLAVAPPTSNR